MTTLSFALHVIWTCYGNWLPGDRRGYVSNTYHPPAGYNPKRNTPGAPHTADDPASWARARQLQKQDTIRLTPEQAVCVAEAMVAAAAKRAWWIARAAVMGNHVHVVVWDCPNDGPEVRRVLKGTTQAALSRQAGRPRTWWTDGGSNRYKNDAAAVEAAVNYVANQDGMLAEVVDMEVRVAALGGRESEPRG